MFVDTWGKLLNKYNYDERKQTRCIMGKSIIIIIIIIIIIYLFFIFIYF